MGNKGNRQRKLGRRSRAAILKKNFTGCKSKSATETQLGKEKPIQSHSTSHNAQVLVPVLDIADYPTHFVLVNYDEGHEESNVSSVCKSITGEEVSQVLDNRMLGGPVQTYSAEDPKESQDSQTQVKLQDGWLKFIRNDEQLKLCTGIESFKLLRAIVEQMKLATKNKYETYTTIMNTENRVVMVYLKLKQNLMYDFLALMFDSVSEKQCEDIFKESIVILSECLRTSAMNWPSQQTILSNPPQCFKSLKNVRVLIDCIQISMYARGKFSEIHGATSFKIILGISPSGMISFVDNACGGHLSDPAIFKQSNLLQLLEDGDCVMVNKKFSIAESSNQYKFHIIQCGGSTSSFQGDSAFDSPNAKVMKIFEKVHRWIREFDILHTPSIDLVMYVDNILSIICATFNLRTPIINDYDFMKRSKMMPPINRL